MRSVIYTQRYVARVIEIFVTVGGTPDLTGVCKVILSVSYSSFLMGTSWNETQNHEEKLHSLPPHNWTSLSI